MNDLTAMTIKELTNYYNSLVDESQQIKKFKDKRTGVQRLRLLLAEKKQDAPKPKVEKPAKDKKPARSGGIGKVITKGLLAGYSTEDILESVYKQFPHANTRKASVSWYRTQLRKEGKL